MLSQWIEIISLLAYLGSQANAQTVTSQTFDDTDPIITYSGTWVHQAGVDGPYNDTQSFSNVADASYGFIFAGTGFSICAGKKTDRGTFDVTIDNVLAGTGTQVSTSTNNAPACETVFAVDNLAASGHNVVVSNTGSGSTPYLTVDSITLQVLSAAVSSSASSSSSAASSTSSVSSRSSSSRSRASSSSSASSVSASKAAASNSTSNSSGSGTSVGAIAGGVVGGIIALALLGALFWFCCFRKKRRSGARREEAGAANPFVSDLDTDENGSFKPNMSQNSANAPIFVNSNSSPVNDLSSGTFSGQPSLPHAVPLIGGHNRSTSQSTMDNRYSNQYMATAAPAPSRVTSYASARSQLPTPTESVPQIPMSFSKGGRNTPSPFAMPAFPTDVDDAAPVEDAYGGMEESEEDADTVNGHIRRPSEADIYVTKAGKGSLRRKPVPQA